MTDRNIDKQEQIIKAAIQLFAMKGSSSTSMQEIAELCGMSKGSLYLVFKSKEELERNIYMYCIRKISAPLLHEEQENRRTPREKLRNQIEILLNHVYELREFLQRQIQEIAGKGLDNVTECLTKSNGPFLNWFQTKIEVLYGKDVVPYTGDLCLMAHGMVKSYIWLIFYQDTKISITGMADHLMDLMDVVASGLLANRPVPLISPTILSEWMVEPEEHKRNNPLQLIKEMKHLVSKSVDIEPEQISDILESLGILEGEILLPHPRKAIIQGMLANLQNFSELATPLEELKKLVSPYSKKLCTFH